MTTPDLAITIGMDAGGSHVTAAAFDAHGRSMLPGSRITWQVDSSGPARELLDAFAQAIRRAWQAAPGRESLGIGIAMPGPFDYEQGISYIRGLNKYEALHGMNLRTAFKERLGSTTPILFRNDAACFLLGECWQGAAQDAGRVIGVTLGTGFGSAFCADGRLLESGPGIPENGWLYNQPCRGATAEEHFSARGLLRMASTHGKAGITSVRELAGAVRAGKAPLAIFEQYGHHMGTFLAPWAAGFAAECLVVGGNISRAFDLFGPALRDALPAHVRAIPSARLEDAALAGAAWLPLHLKEPLHTPDGTTP